MKKLAGFTAALMLLISGLSAQETKELKPADQFKIDVFSEIWLGAPDSAELAPLAPGFAVGFLKDLPINEHFSFAGGLQFRTSHIYMGSILRTQGDSTVFRSINDTLSLKRGKFATYGFELPVEFRWKSDKNPSGNHWKIAVGASIGYNTSKYSKTVYNTDGQFRDYIFPDYNSLHYGAHVRLGIAGFGLFANYQLSPLFDHESSPNIVPMTIGVTLLPN